MGIFGLIFVGIRIAAIGSNILNIQSNKDKFPKPDFGPTRRASVLTEIILGIAFLLAIFEQGTFVWEQHEVFTIDLAKQLTLLATLYLLLMVTVQRKLHSNGIAWTYELETELLLGSVSPEIAARRIEHRGLGPRLQDVMDRFFDDLDRRIDELDSLLLQCRSNLETVKNVPPEYTAERASRIQQATQGLLAHLDTLTNDCSDFGNYLKKLDEKNAKIKNAILAPLLAGLKARRETYVEQLRSAASEIRNLELR